MKLFRVIILLSSLVFLTNCSSTTSSVSIKPSEMAGSFELMPNPIFLGEDIKYGMTAFVWRYTQFMRFRLNKEEKNLHKSAVFFMLQNAPNGKIVSWYSKKRKVNGKVRVIQSFPKGGGYCRVYQAYIKLNGTERHKTNIGCKRDGAPTWMFYN